MMRLPHEYELHRAIAAANYWHAQATRWREKFDEAEDRVCALELQVRELRRRLGVAWRKYHAARRAP